MRHQLLTSMLLLVSLAVPAHAATPTPATRPNVDAITKHVLKTWPKWVEWQSDVDWKTLSRAQKELYVEAYFDGNCATEVLHAIAKPEQAEHMNLTALRARLHEFRDEVIARMDEAYAQNPGQSGAVLTAVLASVLLPKSKGGVTRERAATAASR